MITDNLSPSGRPLPPGLQTIFGCVRPVIFQFEGSDFSAVPGTGFLLELFGEVFFITAKHVAKNFSLENLVVSYNSIERECIPFEEVKTFCSNDPTDTDQVDIIVIKADRKKIRRELFGTGKPFDISTRRLITYYTSQMALYFQGVAPERNVFDFENGAHSLHFAAGSLMYEGPTSCRSIHQAKAQVDTTCPDFDGMSGSPVFWIENLEELGSNAKFAGMLIQGCRKTSALRFMEADRIAAYLLGFFIEGLPPSETSAKIEELIRQHFKLQD